MKNLALLSLILAFTISFSFFNDIYAQQWKDNLPQKKDGNYTFYDYQKAFNNYWKPYNVEGGWYVNSKGKKVKAGGWKQFKRWEWYWEPRVDRKTGKFPDKTAWEVWQDYKSAKNIKSVGGTWTSRGDAILDPIDGGSIQESGTGRLNCALFVPGDNNHYFIGAPAGGLWETSNNGTSWTCLTDNNPIVGVSDIALPPDYNKTTNPTIYIASGDRDAGDDPSIGVLKTTDGGTSWTQTGLDFHDKSGVQIGRLIINPDDKNIMWAATSIGIYRSTDQGANWTFVQGGNFIDMELLPGSTSPGSGTLIATTTGWSPKVYRTTDGGLTWTNTWTSPTTDEYRCDVAVTPANTNNVYIITADGTNNMAFHGLYVSTNGGVSFTQKYAGTTNNLYGWGANNAMSDGGQGWYDATLAVSNTNANVIYIAGVNGFISTNGGTSFTICNAWDSGYGADVIHADHHNAYFRLSDNRLFDVNDGGIYYSDNVTSGSSSTWYSKTDGLVTGQLYDIGIAQTKNNEIISGFQDNGTKLCKVLTTDFDQVIGGDGMCCAINPTNNSIQYGTYAQMRVYKSTNEGGSFSIIRNSGSADWAGPVEADPQGGEVYIADDRVKQYRGTSTQWNNLSQSLDATNYLKVLAVFNDGSDKMIWTAGESGCWKSPLGGGSGSGYTAISGLPADMVTDIDIDDDDYNHVYLCFGGYDNYNVYETTNGGTSWTDISAGLPAVPCGAIVINEQNTTKNEVYVGTDAGIYVRLGNAPWQLFSDGMPFVSITDLEIYYNATPANTRIYASTYGRGLWSSDCYDPPTLDAAISYISVPADEYCALGNISPTVELGNIGTTTLTSATISYTIDGGAPVNQNWTGSLAQGATTNITFPAIALSYGSHDFVATVSNPNGGTDGNSSNDSKSKTFSVWNNDVPYTQTFDNFAPNIGYNGTSVVLEECWSNDGSESSLDWSVTQGETPSGSTGPSGDHTSGNGRYLYTEVSGISTATSVNLLSPTFDLTNYTSNQISFWYQMNGANCGSLQIDLYYAGTWHNGISAAWDGVTATSVSGNKGATWYQVTADISSADGDANVQVRIASTTGTAYDGDIAIDDFNIQGVSACTQPTTQASNITFSGITNNSITANWTQGSGDAEIIVVREGSAVNQDPTSGNTYTANTAFGSGSEIGTGNYVVYDGTAGTVTVNSLTPGTTYYFAVYTYNSVDHCYNITELTGNTTTLGPPSITTTAVSGITGNSANSGGNVSSENGSAVTVRGVCWNTTGTPTTSDPKTSDGTGIGAFVSSMTGLSAVTTYYVRAYATNSYGTSYGNEETFTTSCGTITSYPFTEGFETGTLPACWSNEYVTDTQDWAYQAGGNGGNPAAAHTGSYNAYFYNGSTTANVTKLITPQLDFTSAATATLTFWHTQEFWSPDQDELRIYFKNSVGGSWNLLATYTNDIQAWTQETIALSNISNDYYIAFEATGKYGRGVCLDDINVSITSTGTPPTVTTQAVSNISCTTATGNGNITDLGSPNPTAHGVCWNTTGTPTIADSNTDEGGASATGAFSSSMTGLTAETAYYVRAYATNTEGTSYGNEVSFTTNPLPTAPTSASATSTTICAGSSTDLTYTGGSGTTFGWYTGSCGGTLVGTGNNLTVSPGSTTTYYGRWENTCGNSTCETVTITVNPLPVAPTSVTATPNPITAGNSTTLSYTGGSGTTFTWYTGSCGGTSIGTGNNLIVSPLVTTTYYGAWSNSCGESTCQTVTVTVNPAAITWDGSTDSDWQTASNWSNNAVPGSGDDITIPNGMPNYPIVDDGIGNIAVCSDIVIENAASITINPNGYMTVSGSITNNAGTSGLVINSDATGTGSLIQNTSGGVDATVNRYLESGASRRWHFVASPIAVAPVSIFTSTSNLYYYNESIDDYWTGTTYDSGTSGWTAFSSGNMTVNRGYTYNYFTETLTFTGQLNDNTTTSAINVDYTNHGVTAGNGSDYNDFDGWTFIANPYTSAIDWDDASVAHAAANLTDAIYIYDDATAHTYTSYIGGVGTNGGTQYIPAMQGFFVKGDATETAGTLNIGSAARVHNSQAFWKGAQETPNNFIRLQISANDFSDETVIRLDENATYNIDKSFDAYKLFTWDGNVPQIYTNTNNNTEYSINTIPNIENESISIPLKTEQTGNTYSISITEFNFSDTKVYLKDNVKGETVEIGLNDVLNFTSDEADNTDRFEIIFEKSTTSVNQTISSNVNLYPNPSKGTFYLTVGNNIKDYIVSISNVTGKVVYQNKFNDGYTKEIKLNSKAKGIYFVKVKFNDNSVVIKKIIIE